MLLSPTNACSCFSTNHHFSARCVATLAPLCIHCCARLTCKLYFWVLLHLFVCCVTPRLVMGAIRVVRHTRKQSQMPRYSTHQAESKGSPQIRDGTEQLRPKLPWPPQRAMPSKLVRGLWRTRCCRAARFVVALARRFFCLAAAAACAVAQHLPIVHPRSSMVAVGRFSWHECVRQCVMEGRGARQDASECIFAVRLCCMCAAYHAGCGCPDSQLMRMHYHLKRLDHLYSEIQGGNTKVKVSRKTAAPKTAWAKVRPS